MTLSSGSRWVHPIRASGKAAKPRNKIDLAEARKYWAFQHPKAVPPLQALTTLAGPHSDIDRFMRSSQEERASSARVRDRRSC